MSSPSPRPKRQSSPRPKRKRPSRTRSRPTNPTRPTKPKPVLLAVTGAIGAGKSEALAAFGRHGAAVLSTDDVVHALYAEDTGVRAALEARFGTTDRARIAELVFADPAELEWLEQLLHPRVRAAYAEWLERVDVRVAAVEIPLLYETNAEVLFDAVVVVTAPDDLRRARRGSAVDARAPRFIPDEDKVGRADFAYVNAGSLVELDAFVQGVLERLRSDA